MVSARKWTSLQHGDFFVTQPCAPHHPPHMLAASHFFLNLYVLLIKLHNRLLVVFDDPKEIVFPMVFDYSELGKDTKIWGTVFLQMKTHGQDVNAVFNKKFSSFAIFEGKYGEDFSPYQVSSNFRPRDQDKKFVKDLRKWLADSEIDKGISMIHWYQLAKIFFCLMYWSHIFLLLFLFTFIFIFLYFHF